MYAKDGTEIPLGLGMALMQDVKAYICFAGMDETEQSRVINGAHKVESPEEMRSYVSALSGPMNSSGY